MIKVLFFGVVADKVGKKTMEICAEVCLGELIRQMACVEIKPLLVAVNQEQVHDMSIILKDGDEVALMPPFSGG